MNENLKRAIQENIDEIQPPFDNLLRIIGLDAMFDLSERLGGANFYVPTIHHMFRNCIQKQLRKEFNGSNYRILAQDYSISERTARKWIEDASREN